MDFFLTEGLEPLFIVGTWSFIVAAWFLKLDCHTHIIILSILLKNIPVYLEHVLSYVPDATIDVGIAIHSQFW